MGEGGVRRISIDYIVEIREERDSRLGNFDERSGDDGGGKMCKRAVEGYHLGLDIPRRDLTTEVVSCAQILISPVSFTGY